MKNVSAFLKRHSALLLLVLVLATVPAGIAFGKYVKSVKVTDKISVTVSVAPPASDYTIDKTKLKNVLQGLDNPATALYFVKGSGVPKDAVQVVGKDIQASGSGRIFAYQKGTYIYIAPADRVDAPLHAPADSSYFLSVNYNGGLLSVKESKIRLLTYIKCDNLDTSGVTDMSHMFCMVNDYGSETALATLDVSKFNTEKVTNMSCMFQGCSALTSLDLKNFNTSNVETMESMFDKCKSLTSLNLSNFNTEKVTNMSCMFRGCSALPELNLSNFNTSNVTTMSYMFNGCTLLPKLNLSNFNTNNVTTMLSMFQGCSALPELDLSNFNTSNVETMESMFQKCSNLTTLDLSKFKTSKVTTMSSMFAGCGGLTSLNVSSFDTSSVIYMSFMFKNCTALPTLDVRNFDTSNATKMQYMFAGCSSLTALDLSRFNTSEVNNMQGMFCDCSNLATINASDEFKTDKVTSFMSSTDMFTNCTNLKGGNRTTYNSSKTDKTYAWIDGKNDKPGYFTDKNATSTSSAIGSIEGSGISLKS